MHRDCVSFSFPYKLAAKLIGFAQNIWFFSEFQQFTNQMVISSIFTGTHQPVRSVSLPARVELEPESLLQTLKSFRVSSSNAKTTPFGLEEIQVALVGLAELYNTVGELVQSCSTQQALVHYKEGKLVEEALNESVVLIDSCSSARDIILTMKQSIQILQSALRRKGADSSIENHVRAYFSFRRKAKKDIGSCLGALKRMENDRSTFPLLDLPNHDLLPLIRLLREARTISISIFGELLVFLSAPVTKGKASGWSLVSQLMPVIKLGSGKRQKRVNELESVDIALHSLIGHGHRRGSGGNDNKAEVQMAQMRLRTLAASFEGIESGLDCMFRCLVKHRVCFLNMLAH